jgi:undecaprenyl-diphosphatase
VDAAIFAAVNGAHFPAADAVMLALTRLGYGAGVWFALALTAMAWRRHRAAATRTLLALGVVLAVNDQIVKPRVARPRPFLADVAAARVVQQPPPTTPSFPSGHTASAVVGAMSLSRVWPMARPALWLLGAGIALSRVYVGVHYPSDILAGALLGLAVAWLVLAGRHPSTGSRVSGPADAATHVP